MIFDLEISKNNGTNAAQNLNLRSKMMSESVRSRPKLVKTVIFQTAYRCMKLQTKSKIVRDTVWMHIYKILEDLRNKTNSIRTIDDTHAPNIYAYEVSI